MISIRIKLTIVVVILLSLFLGLLLLGNALLLESYYISQTKAPFLSVYEELLTMPLSRPQQVSFLRKLGAETGYKIVN